MPSIGVYRNIFGGSDHAAEADVKIGTVYGNGVYLGSLDTATDYPHIDDVRFGTSFNFGADVGLLDLPSVNVVRAGVDFDQTTKTGNSVAPPVNVVVEDTGYGSLAVEFIGTLPTSGALPSPNDVRFGVTVGEDVGLLDLPSVNKVRAGISFDQATKTGNSVTPPIGSVEAGVGYGSFATEFVGILDVSGQPPPPTAEQANVYVDLVDQFGVPVEGAQVYATTKAFEPAPGTDNLGIIEKKDDLIFTSAAGRAAMTLIKGSAFADPDNNTYIISYTLDREVYRFEYLVTDADDQVATESLAPP